MIPLRDVIPSRTTPVVTLGLIGVHACVFLFSAYRPGSSLLEAELTWGLVPAQFTWLTLATSIFLHDGWMHLVANLWALWIFGDNVEDRLGRGWYLLFYLLTAAAGALVQLWVAPQSLSPIVGPSGAIAAVIGAYLAFFPRSRILVLVPIPFFLDVVEIPATAFMGLWLAAQLLVGVGRVIDPGTGGGIAFLGLAAGLVVGLGLGAILRRRQSWN